MALEIRVLEAHQTHQATHSSEYTVYRLSVTCNDWSQVIEKRYSNFLELHRVMKMRFYHTHLEKLPKFPGKKVLKHVLGGLSERDIEERRVQLEQYMQRLEANACARESHYFLEFLQLPQTVAAAWMRHRATLDAEKPV